MLKVKNSYNILTVNLAKRGFKQISVALNEKNKNSDDWNDFIGSLSNTKKTEQVYNRPKNNNKSFARNKNNKDFNNRNNKNFNNKKLHTQNKSGPNDAAKNQRNKLNEKSASTSSKKKEIDVDLSIFDSAYGTSSVPNPASKKSNYAERTGNQKSKSFNPRRTPQKASPEFNPDRVISGHSYGVKEYRIESKTEETARRLTYKAVKNDDKVVLGTAMKFFKSHSNYTQPEIFLNPNMLVDTSRECMKNVPRMINSKEHALRDAGFDVYKKLANENKFRTEKISQIMQVQEWEELPEGFNLNDPSWDYIERKHMIHSSLNKGSTYEHVHESAKNAINSDESLKLDVSRLDSILNGKFDQDYLGDLGLNKLSDFQTKFKGIYAPNVIENLYQSSKMLKTAINNSPAFINHPERKQELFEYMSLLKPTNRILDNKKIILSGHKPGKANA
ncbi:hypothetical protein HANVADRAFT_59847 [Hanseniaspora valbyensis NRRL Y-1626]|uniref:Uncharacterized protein n=1 Tax=Hanseniaspora valbyensis NRRL Y-1626 TaxID=766949 RepID=A0A1B7TB27_9ASCO|nr:hypothetical protein HANVADRAFT_59847 [Hanseniaspora valbyensis NRRL Y-1626]